MCSKMISESSYVRDKEDDYSGLCPKKQKLNGRRKVPRRGPGVAELEKIRLEEQHTSPLPPPLEKSITNNTGPVYPFSSYFSTGSFPNDLIPPAPVFQRKHDSSLRYLPPMNLPIPGSGGLYQFIEPHLNQTSPCIDNVSQFLDQEKLVNVKRTWNFMADSTKCSVGPTNFTISRDGKQIRPVDLRLKNHIQDSRSTIRNSIPIDSLPIATPPTPIITHSSLEFQRFIQKEETDHEIMRRSDANLSLNRKPFYSFFPSNDQNISRQDPSFSLTSERHDKVTDHGIDLRLKL